MSASATGRPSTDSAIPPIASRLSPVALTTTSASSSAPEASRIPVSVNVSIVSVITDAVPP